MMSLGNRFYQIQQAQLDQEFAIKTRLFFESVKLTILDSAEAGVMPPLISDAQWIYDLWLSDKKYGFLFTEFRTWLTANDLDFDFIYLARDDHDLAIIPNKYKNFDAPEVQKSDGWIALSKPSWTFDSLQDNSETQ
jgi:hypothetical protein